MVLFLIHLHHNVKLLMADNLLVRLKNAFVNKNHRTYSLDEHDRGFLSLLGGTLSYIFSSKRGRQAFNYFLNAFATNPLVAMVVSKISFTSASIKRIAVDENGDDIKKGKSELLKLIENPNQQQGSVEFYDEINQYLTLTGNAFVRYIEGVGGFGVELKILAADRVDILTTNLGIIVKYRFTDFDSRVYEYDVDDILHIKSANVVDQDATDRLFGLSPLEAMKPVIESSNEKFSAEASIFKNRGIIGFASNDTDVPMLDDEREEAQNSFDRGSGGSQKFNSIFVTNTRLRFVQTGMSPTDLKLLEGIVSSLRLLCARYSMPSILFNDTEKSTYNNFEQAIKVAYNDVYVPLANKVDKSLSPWLSEKLGVEETIKADLTSIEVLKANTNEVAQALGNLDKESRTRVLENMTQEEIRTLVTLGVLKKGEVVIGAGTPATNETTET